MSLQLKDQESEWYWTSQLQLWKLKKMNSASKILRRNDLNLEFYTQTTTASYESRIKTLLEVGGCKNVYFIYPVIGRC